MLKKLIPAILFLLPVICHAQIGGTGTYAFLNVNPSARVAALSGSQIALRDYDPSLAFVNPASLNKEMHRKTTVSYTNYFSDINNGLLGYVHHVDSVGTFSANIMYMNYGKFDGYDEYGTPTGTFGAADYCLTLGYGNSWKKGFSYGGNFKMIYSNMATWSSFGLALDLAASYQNDEKLFSATVLTRNIGVQLKPYTEGNRENLPFEIQVGLSKKLAKAPFRFFLLGHNLQTPDISYLNINSRDKKLNTTTNEEEIRKPGTADKIFRHVTFGTELVFGQYFNIRFAYSHQRKQELRMENPDAPRGLMGFSWGLGMKLGKFVIGYGATRFSQHKSSNYFTVTTNLSDYKKKKPAKAESTAL